MIFVLKIQLKNVNSFQIFHINYVWWNQYKYLLLSMIDIFQMKNCPNNKKPFINCYNQIIILMDIILIFQKIKLSLAMKIALKAQRDGNNNDNKWSIYKSIV